MLNNSDLFEADMMKSLAVVSMLLALVSYSAGASPLYQWTGKDGTPTFSPDPPPKGIKYTIVGPDLQPLANQPDLTPPATTTAAIPEKPPQGNTTAVAKAGSIVLTPAPQQASQPQPNEQPMQKKPASQWKPVKYADDPNPNAEKPFFSTGTRATATVAPTTRVSDECLRLKQQQLILESQFAGARNARDMDTAILKLSTFNKQNKGTCGF